MCLLSEYRWLLCTTKCCACNLQLLTSSEFTLNFDCYSDWEGNSPLDYEQIYFKKMPTQVKSSNEDRILNYSCISSMHVHLLMSLINGIFIEAGIEKTNLMTSAP